ncbi:fimbrial protein [Pseudomonas sp. JH-2]|uniref:fimbrial protein n=1 Tax=Pseudomonas sp. JH-2 TaxID=3114998 RepID=UPI002E252CB1|nr:fimbrial protein [Pseudomonas sp. JH-2]
MKLSTLLFAVGALPGIVFAAPTVTFQGEVTAQTCKASINGETNSIVLLPTVASTELSAAGSKAGLTPFTISISECQAPTGDLAITTNFLGHNVTAEGNLGNIAASNPASNVAIQLTKEAAGTTPVVLNGVTPVAGLVLADGETSASYQFGAQYISVAGNAGAGAVTAVAEYTLSYL